MKTKQEALSEVQQHYDRLWVEVKRLPMDEGAGFSRALSELCSAIRDVGFLPGQSIFEFINHISETVISVAKWCEDAGLYGRVANLYELLSELYFAAAKAIRFRKSAAECRALASPGNFWSLKSMHFREKSRSRMPQLRNIRHRAHLRSEASKVSHIQKPKSSMAQLMLMRTSIEDSKPSLRLEVSDIPSSKAELSIEIGSSLKDYTGKPEIGFESLEIANDVRPAQGTNYLTASRINTEVSDGAHFVHKEATTNNITGFLDVLNKLSYKKKG